MRLKNVMIILMTISAATLFTMSLQASRIDVDLLNSDENDSNNGQQQTNGKLVYSRDYLLQLKKSPLSNIPLYIDEKDISVNSEKRK